jgi:hypothetical protein
MDIVFQILEDWLNGMMENWKSLCLCDGVEGWELIHTLARNLYTDLLYSGLFGQLTIKAE